MKLDPEVPRGRQIAKALNPVFLADLPATWEARPYDQRGFFFARAPNSLIEEPALAAQLQELEAALAAACGELSELQHGATPLQAPDAKTKLSLASRMAVSLQAQSAPVRRHGFR